MIDVNSLFFIYHAPLPCCRFSFSSLRTLLKALCSTFSRLSLLTMLSALLTARSRRCTSCSRSVLRSLGDDASIFLARFKLSFRVLSSSSCRSERKPYCVLNRSGLYSPAMCRKRGSRGTYPHMRSNNVGLCEELTGLLSSISGFLRGTGRFDDISMGLRSNLDTLVKKPSKRVTHACLFDRF